MSGNKNGKDLILGVSDLYLNVGTNIEGHARAATACLDALDGMKSSGDGSSSAGGCVSVVMFFLVSISATALVFCQLM